MQDTFYIETVKQAGSILKPQRIELLKQLDRPRTCTELAEIFGQTPQQVYYHIKTLEKAGLVEKVAERRVRGTVEGHYQAKARSYWLAPHLVGQVGGPRQVQDQASLRFLLNLAEEVIDEVGRLGHRSEAGQQVPSLGLSAHIYLADSGRRAAFMRDVQEAFQELAGRYGLPAEGTPEEGKTEKTFRLALVCYPRDDDG